MPIIFELATNNFKNYKNIILFLGKNGKKKLKSVVRQWQFDYKEKQSLTNKDSFLIKINCLKKI